jgi:1-acyl-sn-glycerol-3-phosphate acyltransferase
MEPAASPAVEPENEARGTGSREAVGELFSDARFVLNRHIFRTMLATSGAAAVLLNQILPRRHWLLPDHRTVWGFAKLQARNLARLCGVEVAVRGLEHVRDGGPFIFTPNHQSHFDIAALLGFLPGDNRFATKKELFSDPILGSVLDTLGMIPIDREQPLESVRTLGELEGVPFSIIIFPEGTRGPGDRLLPFKKGPFVVAIRLGMPVVPIAIRGAGRVMPKGGYLGIRPGRIEIIVEKPIPTAGLRYEDRGALREQVRRILSAHVEAAGS